MPTLLLIRHGENDYLKKNRMPGRLPGIHLNSRGREQAEDIANSLKQVPITNIYSSPLERAVETSEPLALAHRLEIQLRSDLTDTDVGEWTGHSWKVLRRTKHWEIIHHTPSSFQFPKGETFIEVQTRIVIALNTIAAAHARDEIAAIVFHADPIKLAVAHLIGLPLDKFQRLTVDPGSVTVLSFSDSGARLQALNLIPPFGFSFVKNIKK